MCRLILLLIILIPAVELGLLIEVGGQIGGFETMALVVLTAAIGLHYVRVQGAFMPMRIQRGEIEPTQAALEGAILSVGALALLIPGFVTDFLGMICLLPPTRKLIGRAVLKRVLEKMTTEQPGQQMIFRVGMPPSSGTGDFESRREPTDDSIIVIKPKKPSSAHSPPDESSGE